MCIVSDHAKKQEREDHSLSVVCVCVNPLPASKTHTEQQRGVRQDSTATVKTQTAFNVTSISLPRTIKCVCSRPKLCKRVLVVGDYTADDLVSMMTDAFDNRSFHVDDDCGFDGDR